MGLAVGRAIYTLWGYVIATPASAGLGYGLGLRPSDISLFTAVFSVGSFVGGFVTGRLLRTVWPGPVAMAVFAVCALGYTVTAFGLSSAVQFGIGVLILAFSSGSGYALFYNLVAQTVSPQRQASTAAAVTVRMNIGGAILPVVIIAILNSTAAFADGAPLYTADGVRLVFLLPAALALVLVAVGAVLAAYQKRHGGRLREAEATESAVPTSA